MRIAVSSWSEGERRSATTNRMLVTSNFLRTHLTAALPLFSNPVPGRFGSDEDSRPRFLFRGEQKRLQYAGTLPPQVRGGLYKFELYWQQVNDRSDLKLAIWPLTPPDPAKEAETIDDVTIVEDVEAFSIAYLKVNDGDGKTEWLNEWNEATMPALIRVEIAVQGEPGWPPLMVSPVIEGRR
jgi:hypothetical protein